MGAAAVKPENPQLSYRLFIAIKENNFNKASDVILKGANVNCTNLIGGTPLIEMCRSKEHDEQQRTTFVNLSLSKRSRYKDIRYLRMDGSTVCTGKWTRINS
jgi:hypothetical protein